MIFDVPVVTSQKPTDCGATCLKMLLEYYGIDVPLDKLIEDCHTRIIGCSGKDLLHAARENGLTDITTYRMDAEELIRQDRPAIIWWMYNHFVVFCGTDENGKVVLNNPDKGRYRVTPGVFKSFFTEISFWNGEPHDLPEAVDAQ